MQVAEKELFPHVLEEEIHRRRENAAGSYISIDVKKLNPNYILVDKERRTATLTKSHKLACCPRAGLVVVWLEVVRRV